MEAEISQTRALEEALLADSHLQSVCTCLDGVSQCLQCRSRVRGRGRGLGVVWLPVSGSWVFGSRIMFVSASGCVRVSVFVQHVWLLSSP